MNNELKEIKKLYGEETMHLCRELFPDILEEDGKLLSILKDTFYPTHKLGHDINYNCFKREFMDFIYEIYTKGDQPLEEEHKVDYSNIESPEVLLDRAGYKLYKCESYEELRKYYKYYAPGEELCSFEGGRLEFCDVYFAIKKNVNDIKREDFKNPKREDEYSTSVLCIQFAKKKPNYVYIISRYNVAVFNPNATYSNNLDRIVPGLTESFKKYYHYSLTRDKLSSSFLKEMQYVKSYKLFGEESEKKEKFYRYNYELSSNYYCDNNIVIKWGWVDDKYAAKERYIFVSDCILDRKEKEFFGYSNSSAFVSSTRLGDIERTEYTVLEDMNVIKLYFPNDRYIVMCTNKNNELIYYENIFITKLESRFLANNNSILYLNVPGVTYFDDDVLRNNDSIIEINSPLVRRIGNEFMVRNTTLSKFYTPMLKKIGLRYMPKNRNFSKVKSINYYRIYNSRGKTTNLQYINDTIDKQRSRRYPNF